MRVPWIRVHGALIAKPVVTRLHETCKVSRLEAVGLLVTFWGSVSQHASNGQVAHYSDAQIEAWAGWTRRRGAFAKWLREHHLDEDGRVREWNEYAGKLEAIRERDRQRKSHGIPAESQRNSSGTPSEFQSNSTSTRGNETRRDEDETTPGQDQKQGARSRAPDPPWVGEAVAAWTGSVGLITPTKMRRALAPLVDEYGWDRVAKALEVGSSRVDLQACKLEYSIVSPK